MNVLYQPQKMEDFRLFVFDDEVQLSEKKWNDITSTEETYIQFFIVLFLRNEKSIIYKKKSGD